MKGRSRTVYICSLPLLEGVFRCMLRRHALYSLLQFDARVAVAAQVEIRASVAVVPGGGDRTSEAAIAAGTLVRIH
jgi:hypothetical protein